MTISADGTNWHVVSDVTGPVNVVFPDGFRSTARVLRVDLTWISLSC